jgi:hypothetical protein
MSCIFCLKFAGLRTFPWLFLCMRFAMFPLALIEGTGGIVSDRENEEKGGAPTEGF